jgi:hypothetical protein
MFHCKHYCVVLLYSGANAKHTAAQVRVKTSGDESPKNASFNARVKICYPTPTQVTLGLKV